MIVPIALTVAALAADEPTSGSGSEVEGAAHAYRLTLTGGAGGVGGPPSVGGFVVGRVVLDLGAVAVDVAGREGYATSVPRTIGSIFAGARVGEARYLRGGLAHHHETVWDVFLDAPTGAILGVAEGITHRTGLEVGGGVDAPILDVLLDGRVGVVLDGSVGWLPDDGGPNLYGWLELAISLDVVR